MDKKILNKRVFSIWLKDFMKQYQIRQYQLAKKSGIHSNTIQTYRNGRNLPNLFNFVLISTALSMLSGVERKEILESLAVAALKG